MWFLEGPSGSKVQSGSGRAPALALGLLGEGDAQGELRDCCGGGG